MSRRIRRVEFDLDKGDIDFLPREDVFAILRAADELIGKGGRNMLVKILKGSKEKRLLELGLDACPSYGYYSGLKAEEISHRVDWMILAGYLTIQYDYRLPMLVFTEKGWELEKLNYASEVFEDVLTAARKNDESIIERLREHTNRQVVTIVLEKIRDEGTGVFIPLLEKWKAIEVKKVKAMINAAIIEIQKRQ